MKAILETQLRTLLAGIYDQANNMLPVREKSYEEGQRQGLLDVAGRIARIVKENAKAPARRRKRSDA